MKLRLVGIAVLLSLFSNTSGAKDVTAALISKKTISFNKASCGLEGYNLIIRLGEKAGNLPFTEIVINNFLSIIQHAKREGKNPHHSIVPLLINHESAGTLYFRENETKAWSIQRLIDSNSKCLVEVDFNHDTRELKSVLKCESLVKDDSNLDAEQKREIPTQILEINRAHEISCKI
jgi:hypothetical protein